MLSYELLNYYEYLDKELEELEKILNPVFEWVERYKKFILNMSVQVLKSGVSSQGAAKLYSVPNGRIKENYVDVLKEFKSEFSSYRIFDAVGKFKQRISEYKKYNGIMEEDEIYILIQNTDELFIKYDEFQKDDIEQSKFISFANKLIEYKVLYQSFRTKYSYFVRLETDLDNFDINKEQKLKIQLLDVEYSLKEFSENLLYIDETYNEIGNLIYSEENEVSFTKLQVLKIESGSLFSEVLGDKKIIEIFTKILKRAIQWVQSKDEGDLELEKHKKLMEALKADTEVMQTLELCGCDVDASKQLLSKAMNIIAKDMLNLARSSYNIKVNDEQFKVDNYKYRNLLDSTGKKRLNSKNEIEENLDE